ISGRGVGLDIVKDALSRLHGRLEVSSQPGAGTTIVILVPLTLAAIRVLLLQLDGQIFALVSNQIEKLVRVRSGDLKIIEGKEMFSDGTQMMPAVSLATILGLKQKQWQQHEAMPVVVISIGERRLAMVVDSLMSEQEVLVKGLGSRLKRLRYFSGASILP